MVAGRAVLPGAFLTASRRNEPRRDQAPWSRIASHPSLGDGARFNERTCRVIAGASKRIVAEPTDSASQVVIGQLGDLWQATAEAVPQSFGHLVNIGVSSSAFEELAIPDQVVCDRCDRWQRVPSRDRDAPEPCDVCLQKQREHRPLVDLELNDVRPSASDEFVEVTCSLDTSEQWVRGEDLHFGHDAQPDGAEALQGTAAGSSTAGARRRLAPHLSFARALISACASDVFGRRSSPGSDSASRLRPVATVSTPRDHRSDAGAAGTERVPCEFDSSMHRRVQPDDAHDRAAYKRTSAQSKGVAVHRWETPSQMPGFFVEQA